MSRHVRYRRRRRHWRVSDIQRIVLARRAERLAAAWAREEAGQ